MGAVLSILKNAVRIFISTASILKELSTVFNQALKRATLSPGLPNSAPSQPYWLSDPPYPELVDIRSPSLPQTADVVIIGSGIAGAAVARSLLHERRRRNTGTKERVVVLDARQLSSGATARNGGHIKPALYESFSRLSKLLPKNRAAALAQFQYRHVECLIALCQSEGIECAEARKVETVDFFLDGPAFSKAVADAGELEKWLPEIKIVVWNGDQAQEGTSKLMKDQRFGVNNSVVGALSYQAGAIWAYRFVAAIWNGLLKDFPHSLSIETNTPAESISVPEEAPAGFPYAVQTARGTIFARQVVHATNGFASHLIPGLRSKIVGARGHMSAQQPGRQFPYSDGQHSWSVVYGDGFDYATQRPPATSDSKGDLLIGGGFTRSLKQGIDQVGLYDDGNSPDPLTTTHVTGLFPAIFHPQWGAGAELKQLWTGILGMTGDSLPLVGRLTMKLTGRDIRERKPMPSGSTPKDGAGCGEWIVAGFSGEGMVWAWLSGAALGIMIAGSEDEELPTAPGRPGGKLREWFPGELLVSRERIRSADIISYKDITELTNKYEKLDSMQERRDSLVYNKKVTALRGETAVIDAGGNVDLILNRDSHLALNHAIEVIGKVDQNLHVKVQAATDFGTNIDFNAVNAVVEATHRYKEIFYDDE
ncbi:fad dependent oxidoreductase [Pyrenophora seminiperda CCB06]|uniref:Fad dependent oxidoreductase n=1 Tax=Pyrenophora seminiperda CCB06 TaxID=1302712 RepID=A0A3M7M786_9PLEO|nr:fad dependent oxidoreductase [Pyrenophora seminiperda CCB06]